MVKTALLALFFLCLCGCETYTSSTPGDYRTMAYQDAVNAGIPADKFVKQIDAESSFNPYAISPAGAIGIAQFMPDTAAGLGIDPHDPDVSLKAAAGLMASYTANYGDYRKALAAYNCGTYCLNKAMQNCSFYYWCLPLETEGYINKIDPITQFI